MICSHCYNSDLQPADLFFFRRDDGVWEMRCRICAGNDLVLPHPKELAWLSQQETADESPEVKRVITEVLLAAGKISPKANDRNKRAYERYQVSLSVSYRLPGVDVELWKTGEILDLSKGGMRFISGDSLPIGAIIPVHIVSSSPQQAKVNFHGEVAIVRCQSRLGTEGCEVGARFVERKNADNRRSERRNVLFNVWYQRRSGGAAEQGTLLDISSGGVALIVTENVPAGEMLFVCVRGDSGVFKNQEIRALVRVVRSTCVYAGNYELGTEFVRTKVTPCNSADDSRPEHISL